MYLDRYRNYTKQGYPVTNRFHDKNGRLYVVARRKNDYIVCAGYSTYDGTWNQGYYDFVNRQSAVKFAKRLAYGYRG